MMSPEYDPPQNNPSLEREQDRETTELLANAIHAVRGIGYALDIGGSHEPDASLLEISVSADHFHHYDQDYNPQIPDALFGIPRFDTVTLLYAFDKNKHLHRPALEIRLEKNRDSIATLTRGENEGPDMPFHCNATVSDKMYSLTIPASEVNDLLDQIIVQQAVDTVSPALLESDLQHPERAWALSATAVQQHNAQQTYSHYHKFTPSKGNTDVTIGIEIDTVHEGDTDMYINLMTHNDIGVNAAGELYERRESVIGRFGFDSQAQSLDARITTSLNDKEGPVTNDLEAIRLFHAYITHLYAGLVIKGRNFKQNP